MHWWVTPHAYIYIYIWTGLTGLSQLLKEAGRHIVRQTQTEAGRESRERDMLWGIWRGETVGR